MIPVIRLHRRQGTPVSTIPRAVQMGYSSGRGAERPSSGRGADHQTRDPLGPARGRATCRSGWGRKPLEAGSPPRGQPLGSRSEGGGRGAATWSACLGGPDPKRVLVACDCPIGTGTSVTSVALSEVTYPLEWAGFCPICATAVVFRSHGSWYRDQLVCTGCGSVPRQRALIQVLEMIRPDWRHARTWEVAPAGPASNLLSRQCASYLAPQYWPDVARGSFVDGIRCEDLESIRDSRMVP